MRLVEDIVAIADARLGSMHYGGTLLTFPEPGAAGVVSTIRVVDGQQRLTTVSILLACIADKLGSDGECGGWTRKHIINDRLTNPGKSAERIRKLRLQDGDECEYVLGLDGNPSGPGAVTQAWKIARRLVDQNDVDRLLRGLDRLRVVSIGLDENEDPQQIFESLNATGRLLTESEKVKNWLLMGLPDKDQQSLHENYWLRIEQKLGAMNSTGPIDLFLRDVLRWRTGAIHGIDRVYEGIRRWAVQTEKDHDRPAICKELADLSLLYGIITGSANPHHNFKVERELRHMREMGIDVHRPFTLRLLNDARNSAFDEVDLASTLAAIGNWTTRMWLSGRPMAGMNTAFAELAHEEGPEKSSNSTKHWLERINRRKNTRVGVPGDQEVIEGIQSRKAYGGSATKACRAILSELMEAEHKEEAPDRKHLTIEHIMPQKLTAEWKHDLGNACEEIHGRFSDRMGNLTLSGDVTNSKLGGSSFSEKKAVYKLSSIGMTRKIANELIWNEAAIVRRASNLAQHALARWPWDGSETNGPENRVTNGLRWRIGDGNWHEESTARETMLNVVAALFNIDPGNGWRLSGKAIKPNIHSSKTYPPGTFAGSLKMQEVPGHPDYVMFPHAGNNSAVAKQCRKFGERCGVQIEVEFNENTDTIRFWKFLREETGGLPGQKLSWQGDQQETVSLNENGDRVGIYIGRPDLLWLYIRASDNQHSMKSKNRMRRLSSLIKSTMGDQQLVGDIEKRGDDGLSIKIQRPWTKDDETDWLDAALWIGEQFERLKRLIESETNLD